MAFNFTGTDGLFVRLGHFIQGMNEINVFRGGDLGVPSGGSPVPNFGYRLATIQGDYAGNSVATPSIPDQSLIDTMFTQANSYRSVFTQQISYWQQVAQNLVVKAVNDYAPQPNQSFVTALNWLTGQMAADSYVPGSWAETILQNVVSIGAFSRSTGSNTGNGVVVASGADVHGLQLQYVIPETLTVTCTQDASNGAISGQEIFSVVGGSVQSQLTNWNWPQGSGTNVSVRAVDATVGPGTNLLTNSDFEQFTSNIPNNWTSVTTTPGTTVLAGGSGNAYTGVNCLEFAGNATELTSIAQVFGSSGGTTPVLQANTVYAFSCVAKITSGATGVLALYLGDSSNGYAVLESDSSGTTIVSTNLTTLSTSYQRISGFFSTGQDLVTAPALVLKLTTAINASHSLYIDHLAMTPATQLYIGGPYLAVFSGSVAFHETDYVQSAITNTMGKFNQGLWQLFNLPAIQSQLTFGIPYSGSPNISDSLVV